MHFDLYAIICFCCSLTGVIASCFRSSSIPSGVLLHVVGDGVGGLGLSVVCKLDSGAACDPDLAKECMIQSGTISNLQEIICRINRDTEREVLCVLRGC